MGASNITVNAGVNPKSYGSRPAGIALDNWPAHTSGGARIGTDSTTSVFNKYHQSWTAPNLFACGEITDSSGDNTTIGGTHPMGAAAYVACEGIIKYLQSPDPLV